MKSKYMPQPMKPPATTWLGQGMVGLEVQANQNMPAGIRAPPMIISGRRDSGLNSPVRV